MANKRQATKRATQAVKRQDRNSTVKSATKTAVKKAIEAVQSKDMGKAKEAYMLAIKALKKDDTVIKYGVDIGRTIAPNDVGEHAHVHNIKTKRW